MSFILSLIAFYLPNWKYIQRRSSIISSDMDPLIRGEAEKYNDLLYRRGEIHSIGLITHCINGRECGRNFLPSFDETNYKLCHNIKYHQQCIFSNSLLSDKCACQKPFYLSITYVLLLVILVLQIIFIFVNFLRLYHYYCFCLNDIHLRIVTIISSLFSSVSLIIIIIQHNNNRRKEPLEFFELMRRYYSRIQIYPFSKDLESIIKQIENDIDIRLGPSYMCIVLILILTIIYFLTSSTIEIKILSIFEEEDETKNEQNHVLMQRPSIDRFVPSEQIRYTRQTKV